ESGGGHCSGAPGGLPVTNCYRRSKRLTTVCPHGIKGPCCGSLRATATSRDSGTTRTIQGVHGALNYRRLRDCFRANSAALPVVSDTFSRDNVCTGRCASLGCVQGAG